MACGWSYAAFAGVLACAAACRVTPPRAIDAELAACVPAEARMLAGAHLDQVRAAPGLQELLAGWLTLLEPARDASSVLVAYTGSDLLWAAHGDFRTPPRGATVLSPQLAVTGPPALVRAAAAQRAAGRIGAPALLAEAETVARQPVWAVVPGNAPLPLSGNAANLNRLLGYTNYTTLTLDAGSQIGLHVTGICGSADRARQFEETLRGLLSLARATTRDRDLASVFAAVQIRRDDLTVHADITTAPETVQRLLQAAAR